MPRFSITLQPITILNATPPQPQTPVLTSVEADGNYYLGVEDDEQSLGVVIRVDSQWNAINIVSDSDFYINVEDAGNNMYYASFDERHSTPLPEIPSYNYQTARVSAYIENATFDAPNNRITADLFLEIDDYVFIKEQGEFTVNSNNLVSAHDLTFIPD